MCHSAGEADHAVISTSLYLAEEREKERERERERAKSSGPCSFITYQIINTGPSWLLVLGGVCASYDHFIVACQ